MPTEFLFREGVIPGRSPRLFDKALYDSQTLRESNTHYICMEGVEGSGSGSGDPLATVGEATGNSMPAVSTVFVTIPQAATIVSGSGGKGVQYKWVDPEIQSVIQQPQPSVIQSPLQTVQISKGNVILLKQPNSVIQSTGGNTLQTVQVIDPDETEADGSRKRQILARRPSYRKILNELGGGEISVIPAGSLQLSQGGEGLQTIAMTNTAGAGGAIVHYAQGSDGQFIVPVATSELGGIKIAGAGGSITQGVVLAAAAPPNTSTTTVHNTADQMAEEASRKREIRLMKNREAAKECRNKKKEYIKCLENRVAVLENQNKALIEELKTLKSLYCQNN